MTTEIRCSRITKEKPRENRMEKLHNITEYKMIWTLMRINRISQKLPYRKTEMTMAITGGWERRESGQKGERKEGRQEGHGKK
jgi:hypothetical protein